MLLNDGVHSNITLVVTFYEGIVLCLITQPKPKKRRSVELNLKYAREAKQMRIEALKLL